MRHSAKQIAQRLQLFVLVDFLALASDLGLHRPAFAEVADESGIDTLVTLLDFLR